MNKIEKLQPYLLPVIALFFIAVYFPLLKNDPFLQRDDVRIVSPIKNIHNITEYIEAVKADEIADVQPLRDLSYLVDIKIFEFTSIKTFHITNLLLMIVCVYLFMKILRELKFNSTQIIFGVLLFALHPILVSAFGWVSSRKHILGLAFIFNSIYLIIKKGKLTPGAALSYLAAICSHQIFIFFPAWVLIYFKSYKLEINKKLYSLMIIGGIIIFSVGFFKTFYIGTGDDTYGLYSYSEHISRSVLSAGRAASLIMIPVVIAAVYSQGSLYNLVGVVLFILYFYLVYKSKRAKDGFVWTSLIILTFTPTFIAFVNDTYLYLPLAAFIISTLYLTHNYINKLAPVIISILFLFAIKTISASGMWRSDLDLWQYSYEQEHAPYSALQLGNVLVKYDKKLALEYMLTGAKDFDFLSHHPLMKSFVFAIRDSDLSYEKKIQIFKEYYIDHEIYNAVYGLTLIEGNSDQQSKGLSFLRAIIKPRRQFETGSTGDQIIKSLRTVCTSSFDKTYICHELKISY